MTPWYNANHADFYMPELNAAEVKYGIPKNLLARIAYQESHFRTEIVNGSVCSSAGCIGLMQLNPRFFKDAGKDWRADIVTAATELVRLHTHYGNWPDAIMAYDWGEGNVDKCLAGRGSVPTETYLYVHSVLDDVAVPA